MAGDGDGISDVWGRALMAVVRRHFLLNWRLLVLPLFLEKNISPEEKWN